MDLYDCLADLVSVVEGREVTANAVRLRLGRLFDRNRWDWPEGEDPLEAWRRFFEGRDVDQARREPCACCRRADRDLRQGDVTAPRARGLPRQEGLRLGERPQVHADPYQRESLTVGVENHADHPLQVTDFWISSSFPFSVSVFVGK